MRRTERNNKISNKKESKNQKIKRRESKFSVFWFLIFIVLIIAIFYYFINPDTRIVNNEQENLEAEIQERFLQENLIKARQSSYVPPIENNGVIVSNYIDEENTEFNVPTSIK